MLNFGGVKKKHCEEEARCNPGGTLMKRVVVELKPGQMVPATKGNSFMVANMAPCFVKNLALGSQIFEEYGNI